MSSAICFLPENRDIGSILEDTLEQHGVAFERRGDQIEIPRVCEARRLVMLLRHALSEAERDDIYVVEHPRSADKRPRSLDEWHRELETSWFRNAVVENRYSVWFQPIFDTRASSAIAHDCLIRLCTNRMYHHSEIFEAAVSRNELHDFDDYARRLTVQRAARQDQGGLFFIPVNAASVYRPERCLQGTTDTACNSGIPTRRIVFCVSEADMTRDSRHVRRICDYVRGQGFRVALGQVGAGAISGSKIRDLRPDFIKIHKSLVRNVEQPACASAIRKLVEIADRMNSVLIAAGVERVQTMENLWLLGLECMQGFLFGQPAPGIVKPEQDLINLSRTLECMEERSVPVLC